VHLGGRDRDHLRERAEHASALLGWPAPYLDCAPERAGDRVPEERPARWPTPWSGPFATP
jgi:hypothetical protein